MEEAPSIAQGTPPSQIGERTSESDENKAKKELQQVIAEVKQQDAIGFTNNIRRLLEGLLLLNSLRYNHGPGGKQSTRTEDSC